MVLVWCIVGYFNDDFWRRYYEKKNKKEKAKILSNLLSGK